MSLRQMGLNLLLLMLVLNPLALPQPMAAMPAQTAAIQTNTNHHQHADQQGTHDDAATAHECCQQPSCECAHAGACDEDCCQPLGSSIALLAQLCTSHVKPIHSRQLTPIQAPTFYPETLLRPPQNA